MPKVSTQASGGKEAPLLLHVGKIASRTKKFLERASATSIEAMIKAQLCWTGHVIQMDEFQNPSPAFLW